jgi:hypothetical protein
MIVFAYISAVCRQIWRKVVEDEQKRPKPRFRVKSVKSRGGMRWRF